MATICAALGMPLPADAGPDSFNVLPAWLGEKSAGPLREATVCGGKNSMVLSIRHGPWKLIVNADGQYPDKPPADAKDTRDPISEPQLYNLATDPAEQRNLVATQPEKFKELKALLARYHKQGYSRPGWQDSR